MPEDLRGPVNEATKAVGLIGPALGSALGGVLAVVDIALPVAVGGVVFVAWAVVALSLLRGAEE